MKQKGTMMRPARVDRRKGSMERPALTLRAQVEGAARLAALLRRKGVLDRHEDRLAAALEHWSATGTGRQIYQERPVPRLSQELLSAWSTILKQAAL